MNGDNEMSKSNLPAHGIIAIMMMIMKFALVGNLPAMTLQICLVKVIFFIILFENKV